MGHSFWYHRPEFPPYRSVCRYLHFATCRSRRNSLVRAQWVHHLVAALASLDGAVLPHLLPHCERLNIAGCVPLVCSESRNSGWRRRRRYAEDRLQHPLTPSDPRRSEARLCREKRKSTVPPRAVLLPNRTVAVSYHPAALRIVHREFRQPTANTLCFMAEPGEE